MQENRGNILMYQTVDGNTAIEVVLSDDTVWLTIDKMAELFQRNKSTISRHIKNILECGELSADSVVAFFATTANDNKVYNVQYFNLDMIISVGYRVNSLRGVQFRMWATSVLREYLIKGFAMNDALLKIAGGGNYFDELLSRIRDIRSSEKVFYRKVLEIYALSIDYDPRAGATKQFFATVQNKMHYSVHGHTAAEVIYERADADKDFMGLTTWTGALPTRTDAEYALVEMIFDIDDEEEEFLNENDISSEDGMIVISRKISNGRSVSKINGETVTLSMLKKIAGRLIDIHGQHEHQSLLYPDNHLLIID